MNKRNLNKVSSGFRSQQGMSLLELLVSLAVITVAFLALASAQITSFSSVRKATEFRDAKALTNRVLEAKYQELVNTILDSYDPVATFDQYLNCTNTENTPLSDIVNDDTDNGCYGTNSYEDYTVRWRLSTNAINGEVPIDEEGLIFLELQADWAGSNNNLSLSLINFVSCLHIVTADGETVCPAPRDPEA